MKQRLNGIRPVTIIIFKEIEFSNLKLNITKIIIINTQIYAYATLVCRYIAICNL